MSCIVGIVENGKVIMGADCAGSNGQDTRKRSDTKIFIKDSMLFGICGSFRICQLIMYKLVIPKKSSVLEKEKSDMEYISSSFIDSLRECLKSNGAVRIKYGVETFDGEVLIGYNGELYHIECDFQVALHSSYGYDACGGGESYAMGSMMSTPKMNGRNRILKALEAAEEFCVDVNGPFTILEL